MDPIWLIPLVPAAGAALNGLAGIRLFGRRTSATTACAAIAASFALSVGALVRLLAEAPAQRVHEATLARWIPSLPLATGHGIASFDVAWTLRLDPLASVMTLVVTGIGLLIHIYSASYMVDEPRGGHARFFCYMNLFCAFMLLLVLAANFLVLFVGWEGVGLCSYLLIGFWYEKPSAATAGFKAFLVNRIGDWGFLAGVLLVFTTFGTLDFRAVGAAVTPLPVEAGGGPVTLICLLLFVGVTGKSAQLPLHVWLPDAMEGPTPVSALIHAATMVTAGIYLVARNAALFAHAPGVLALIAIVGTTTAIVAALIAAAQTDIKRVLAWSTVSQLGFMCLALGAGAFTAAIFHLVTHAFFKALLFLGAGSVIHSMAGEQDVRRMGGLRRIMPLTMLGMGAGALAISGIPPLAGFLSKDEILYKVFLEHRVLWAVAVATSLLTAFYMIRLMAHVFFGKYRGPRWQPVAAPASAAAASAHRVAHPADPHAHGQAQRAAHDVSHGAADSPGHAWMGPHESPRLMTVPLLTLAAGAVLSGLLGLPPALGGAHALERFLSPVVPAAVPGSALAAETAATHPASRPIEIGLMLLSVVVASAGILGARHVYVGSPGLAPRLTTRWSRLHALADNRFYVDELYAATVVRGTLAVSAFLFAIDRRVIDAAVDGAGVLTRISAWISHMLDKHLVDGLVGLVAAGAGGGGNLLRRAQSGLLQNYALTMVGGVFVLLTVYLLVVR
jgi:NADH-quinone oxidoreductase subunit L